MTYNKETLKNAIVQKLRLNYGCTEQQATDGEMMKQTAERRRYAGRVVSIAASKRQLLMIQFRADDAGYFFID